MSIRPLIFFRLISFSLALAIGIATANLFFIESEHDFLVRLKSVSRAETNFYDSPGGGTASCNGSSSGTTETLDVPAPKLSENRGNTSLKILAKPRPVYSEEARNNGVQGNVILRVTFLASKQIGSIQPVKSLPNGLTDEAIEAAKKISFEPAERNGQPISVTKMVEYTFTIY